MNLYKLILFVLGCSLIFSQGLLAQGDPLDNVKVAVRKRDYPAAINMLVAYLNANAASVGNPKVDEAKRILLQITRTHSTALQRAGKPVEAAQALLDTAAVTAMTDERPGLQQEAKTLLQDAYRVASGKSAASALAIADAFAVFFPDDPPLIAPAERVKLELESLAVDKKARAAHLLREIRRLKQAGVTDEQLRAAGVVESELVARYAEELASRGWALQAASFAQAELLMADPSSAINDRLAKVAEQALASHVDACIQLGNARMIADAVALYLDPTNTAADPTRRTRYEAAAQRAAAKLEPKKLEFPGKFVEGRGTWRDDGAEFTLSMKLVQIGNWSLNWGGESKQADITVAPGAVISDGTIRVSNGHLRLQGAANQPIVLKRVRIECDHRGMLHANNVVFIDCTFSKSGNRYFTNGFSSKWEVTDCLLVQSNFNSLNQRNYGIKFQRCTFVQCDLPDRSMTDDATKDNTGLFRHGWNTIADCQFYDSTLHPSLLWANGQSAFIDCHFAGESTFASTHPLRVQFFTVADNTGFVAEAPIKTIVKGMGKVDYRATVIDPSRLKLSPLWRFVPAIEEQVAISAWQDSP